MNGTSDVSLACFLERDLEIMVLNWALLLFKRITKIVANFWAFLGVLLYTNYFTCACWI